MPPIFQYLLKLSLSLGIVYLFYQLLLRRLTFYNCNRFYLLGYTALCFFIPLINITPALEANPWQADKIASIIPAWQFRSEPVIIQTAQVAESPSWSYWTMLAGLLLAGTVVLVSIFLIRYFSFLRIRRQATLLSDGNMKLYQVNKDIMPFSFGNAIFINHTLHNEDELREIIRHEFVHVRQKHSVDIIWAELLCMINWYNPFVWLLRKSIRQNLEFIADHQVVKSGLDKKQYQYMLLKVIGNNHFSIASQFNFSSLKKRIAMMNKDQTSKRQLLRLLLLVPAVAILLLAFRQKAINQDTISPKAVQLPAASAASTPTAAPEASVAAPSVAGQPAPIAPDTLPGTNEKGYQITVYENKGNHIVVVKDVSGKEVKKILLTEWNKNRDQYEELYGEVPPPPPPPLPPVAPVDAMPAIAPVPAAPSAPAAFDMPAPPVPAVMGEPAPPVPPLPPVIKLPANVKSLDISNGQATVIDKNGKKETYNLNEPAEKAAFEKKYGKLPGPLTTPASPYREVTQAKDSELKFLRRHSKVEKITWAQVKEFAPVIAATDVLKAGAKKGDVFIQIYFKNGNWDMYNLGNKADLERFKKNYGETPPILPAEFGC